MVKKKRQVDPQDDNNSSTESCDERQNQQAGGCSHVAKAVDFSKIRKQIKATGIELEKCTECTKSVKTNSTTENGDDGNDEFSYDKTLWLCLKCGTQLCGRSINGHALLHNKTPHSDSHAIVINTTTFEAYCYDCDKEVIVPTNKKLTECVEFIKKECNKTKEKIENVQSKILTTFETLKPLMQPNDSAQFKTNTPVISISRSDSIIENVPVKTVESLPRVRGLSNLGNTCFFNAVMQCLSQTPYLLTVLKKTSESGEEFELPGGKVECNKTELILPPIKTKLKSWSNLTSELAKTIEELQSSGGVLNPRGLFSMLTNRCPQFAGGDQHDSHELLRHLLESVRNDDLKRYQQGILGLVGYNKDESVNDEMKLKCKFYGQQAQQLLLIPDQVFRGKLVSTLVCQDCEHTSPRQENFLDISLPVIIEKPQPPIRRKSVESSSTAATSPTPSKIQLKKEKDKKLKRAQKQNNKSNADGDDRNSDSSSSSSREHSDADVEDNLIDDTPKYDVSINRIVPPLHPNANDIGAGRNLLEKPDDTPENTNKDSDDEQDSGIATSPVNNHVPTGENSSKSLATNANENECNSILLEVGISTESKSKLMRQHSERLNETTPTREFENLNLEESASMNRKGRRNRTYSAMDWSTTIAPRYACEDNECSIQSCMNNFTAMELMTGNNKVGCDSCTETFNGKNGKTVNTNATKQFLVSSPPAVLILHLKRFQVGPRYMFRKMSKHVDFPFLLDIAPFCASKAKNLPNVNKNQKKLVYSLYGIVEHSGGMHGGHYIAYVKVRPKLSAEDPRWKFLPQATKAEVYQTEDEKAQAEKNRIAMEQHLNNDDENDSDDSITSNTANEDISSGSNEKTSAASGGNDDSFDENGTVPEPPPGKWYYVSDSCVQEASEDRVRNAQAYLLFYERIY